MYHTTSARVPLLRSGLLDEIPGVVHGFTTRWGGVSEGPYASLNLSITVGDDPIAVRENRRRLAEALSLDPADIRLQAQMHGGSVVEIGDSIPRDPVSADAFVTVVRGIPVLVGVADCVPILIASDDGGVVAAVHAGWRGAVAGIVGSTVSFVRERFGIEPRRLRAAIGPAIGPAAFEVGTEVANRFPPAFILRQGGGKPRVNLPGSLCADLLRAGLRPDAVDCADLCTMSDPRTFFSHRGSGGRTGRMVGIVAAQR